MSRLNISPADRARYEKRKTEWGESGPAHNIGHTPVSPLNRTTIVENHKGFVAVNSTERQKQRTFVE